MLLARAFYFFYYAATASLMPFLTLYYRRIGLSSGRIGLLTGMPPLVALLSASLWGALADATRQHRRLLTLAVGGTLFSVLLLSSTTTFLLLIPVVVGYALFMAPIMPLVDNTVVELLGERRDQYGRQRLWGALGWGVGAPLAGLLVEHTGLRWAFYSYLILMSVALAVTFRLPVVQASIAGRFRRGLRSLMTNWLWLRFLVAVFIGSLALPIFSNFLFLYMSELGASEMLMGLSLTVGTISELPLFFFSNYLLDRWGSRGLLVFSLLATAVRGFAYSFVRAPWAVLPIALLHGPCFSAMWVAGVSYVDEIAPEGLGATAQGLFSGVVMGLRVAFGSLIGGLLYDSVGPVATFRWAGVAALAGLLFFVLTGVDQRNSDSVCVRQ
jgi:PPP family 3-phenylpropionic acid transporter